MGKTQIDIRFRFHIIIVDEVELNITQHVSYYVTKTKNVANMIIRSNKTCPSVEKIHKNAHVADDAMNILFEN